MRIRHFRGTTAALVVIAATVLGGAVPANADVGPAQPHNVRVTDLQPNVVTVAWDASAGAEEYFINVAGDAYYPRQRTTTTSHELYLLQGRSYEVTVTARGPEGWSPPSDPVEVTVPVDPNHPYVTTPTGLTAHTVITDAGVDIALSWNPSEGAGQPIRYIVEARHSYVRDTIGSGQPSATYDARPETDYTLRVKGVDVAGRESEWSEPLDFTTDRLPLASAPSHVAVTSSAGGFSVTWDAASSYAAIKDYEVKVSGDATLSRITTGTSAEFDYAPGGDLTVTVRARDTEWQWGRSSTPVEFALEPHPDWSPPTAPTNLRANFHDNGRVGLVEWDAANGGVGELTYTLYIGDMDFERTSGELGIDLEQYFSRCDRPGEPENTFTVTATSFGIESPPSNPITLCF